jgi:hypothetical protein
VDEVDKTGRRPWTPEERFSHGIRIRPGWEDMRVRGTSGPVEVLRDVRMEV